MQAVRDSPPSLCEALLVEGAGNPAVVLHHILISTLGPLCCQGQWLWSVVVAEVGMESRLIIVALERFGPVGHNLFCD